MEPEGAIAPAAGAASLVVVDPSGHRKRVPVDPIPFLIGRQPGNHLILRDSRVSRAHARIVVENGGYVLEDTGSRHGTFVNGKRVKRKVLENTDRVDFGAQDSYQLLFALDGVELKRLMEQVGGGEQTVAPLGVGSNLAKLRAILDLARTLQSSFSIDEVLASVVDTALTITGAERGFLLLRGGAGAALETRVARNRRGQNLKETDLRVPREVIRRALEQRRELLSMNFEPLGAEETRPENSIADLELRSVTCVPLVRIRAGQGDATSVIVTGNETVGVLYMDSRLMVADLAGGNRELLQTLAIEASTVLENARLLQEEQGKHQMEEELRLARTIQQSLLPGKLPGEGWLRASGSSLASHEVGGDYYDVTRVSARCWCARRERGGGRCFGKRGELGAIGLAAARGADHGDGACRGDGAADGAVESLPVGQDGWRKVCDGVLLPAARRRQDVLRERGALPADGGAGERGAAGTGGKRDAGGAAGDGGIRGCRATAGGGRQPRI